MLVAGFLSYSNISYAESLCTNAMSAYNQLTGPYGGPPSLPPITDLSCDKQVQAIKILSNCVSNAPPAESGAFDQNQAIMTCNAHLRQNLKSIDKPSTSDPYLSAATNDMTGESFGVSTKGDLLCPNKLAAFSMENKTPNTPQKIIAKLNALGCKSAPVGIPFANAEYGFTVNHQYFQLYSAIHKSGAEEYIFHIQKISKEDIDSD
jgi:hypothetical protein